MVGGATTQSCDVRLHVRPFVRLPVYSPLDCNSQQVGEPSRTRQVASLHFNGARGDTHSQKVQCKNRFWGREALEKLCKNKKISVTMYGISLCELYIYLSLKDCLLVYSLLQPVLIVCQSITLQCIYTYVYLYKYIYRYTSISIDVYVCVYIYIYR